MGKKVFYAFGFATWLLASNLVEAFFNSGVPVYHSQLATPTVFIALVLDFLLVTLLATLLYSALQKKSSTLASSLVLLALLPGFVFLFNRMLMATIWLKCIRAMGMADWSRTATSDMVMPVPLWVTLALWTAWSLLVFGLGRMKWGKSFGRNGLKIFLLAGGLLGLSLMVNLVRAAVRRTADTKFAAIHTESQGEKSQRPRVVWIVMDELSYDQVFDHRSSDLKLPSFDRMRQESTVYANTRPVSYWTDLALPSLISGQELVELHYSYTDKLAFRHASDMQWQRFDPQQTVFGDAERAGWNVAVAGWWNPYCTVFTGMLQSCFWTFNEAYAPMRAYRGVLANMASSVHSGFRIWKVPPFLQVRRNENNIVIQHALDDINDDSMDMVFIHVGVPHFPYPYDRHTDKEDVAPGHSYLDGLAYADNTLGRFLSAMENTPRWKNTTVIVNGDHSWRTQVWMGKPGWTAEDFKASDGGKFDDRPMLIVHAPGQAENTTVTAATPLLHVHEIVESVLKTGKPIQ